MEKRRKSCKGFVFSLVKISLFSCIPLGKMSLLKICILLFHQYSSIFEGLDEGVGAGAGALSGILYSVKI